jgi:hypothetical protein
MFTKGKSIMEGSLPTLSKIMCPACGKYFSGVTSHAAHSIGSYASQRTRRYLSDDEMKEDFESEFRMVNFYRDGRRLCEERLVYFLKRDRDKNTKQSTTERSAV